MRRQSMLDMYHQLKESGSESDFPNLLGNTMNKKLLARFNGFASPWKQYTMQSDLADFKAVDRIILSEAPDLKEITADAGYEDSKFSDAKYQIQAKTFGRQFTVGRQAVINDDLNGITRMPEMYGRASIRSLVKAILVLLKGGKNAYDGKVLFHLRTAATRNYIASTALANTAAGMTAVDSCCTRIKSQTDPDTGEIMGIKPKFLLTGTTLASVAKQLVKSAELEVVSTSGGGKYNPIANLIPIEEPLIDTEISSTFWAVLADPADCPVIEVGFLDGIQEPTLLQMAPTMYKVAGGGADPWGYEYDELTWKVRFDWAVALAYYQGICRGSG